MCWNIYQDVVYWQISFLRLWSEFRSWNNLRLRGRWIYNWKIILFLRINFSKIECLFYYWDLSNGWGLIKNGEVKGRLNTDTSPQHFWTTFLANDLTEKFKKTAVASAIAIPLPLCFSCFVSLRWFRENLTKPFYFYLSRTCDSPNGTPSVMSLALR